MNVNALSGGVQFNVVPCEMSMMVDIRVTPRDSHEVHDTYKYVCTYTTVMLGLFWISCMCKAEASSLR